MSESVNQERELRFQIIQSFQSFVWGFNSDSFAQSSSQSNWIWCISLHSSCQGLLIQIALSLSIKIDRVYISELQNGIIYIYILSNIFRRISSTLSQAIYEEKFWAIKCGFQTLLSAPSARTLTPILSASKIACSMRLLILSFPKGRKYWTQKPHQKSKKKRCNCQEPKSCT